MIKFLKKLNSLLSPSEVLFLGSVLISFCLLRIPSLIEPCWYGDEGIYQVIGMALNQGRVLYQGIWDNKPPLLYIIYAIFNGDLFSVRLLSIIFGGLSVIVFFLLAKKLFKNKTSIYLSTLFYSLIFAIPLIEGNIANSENFMLLPIISAFYLIFSNKDKAKFIPTFAAGILLSLAFLTKIVAVFDFAALFLTILVLRFYEDFPFSIRSLRRQAKKILSGFEQETVLLISFFSPIIITTLYFLVKGALPDFYRAVFSQNVGYVGYGNNFIFPMGMLYLKLLLLIFSILLILRYRKLLMPSGVLIFIWLSFSLFNATFSARPYTHYLLVLLPSFSLFLGYLVGEKENLLKFTIPIFAIIMFVIFSSFRFYGKIIPYYSNYLSFISNNKSIENYQAFFDRNTPGDYDLANFIQSKTSDNDQIFLWGDNAQVYALLDKLPPVRYIVAYHITFYKDAIDETKKAIDAKKPKFIVQVKEGNEIFNFLNNYELRYKFGKAKIYERQS